jgi:hypothetical protein
MHRTRNAAAAISARMVLSCKALFCLNIFAKLSVMCWLVSSTANGLGSKMVARCSVSVPRTGRIERNLDLVGGRRFVPLRPLQKLPERQCLSPGSNRRVLGTVSTENSVTESLYLKFLIERELRCHSDPRASGAEIEGQVEFPPAADIDPSEAGAGNEPVKENFDGEPTPSTHHPLIAAPSTQDYPVKPRSRKSLQLLPRQIRGDHRAMRGLWLQVRRMPSRVLDGKSLQSSHDARGGRYQLSDAIEAT